MNIRSPVRVYIHIATIRIFDLSEPLSRGSERTEYVLNERTLSNTVRTRFQSFSRSERVLSLFARLTSRRSWLYFFQALVFLAFQPRFFPYTFKRKILVWKTRSCFSDKIHVDRILSEVARIPSPDKILVILLSCLFLVPLSLLSDSCSLESFVRSHLLYLQY